MLSSGIESGGRVASTHDPTNSAWATKLKAAASRTRRGRAYESIQSRIITIESSVTAQATSTVLLRIVQDS
jgi:hypothetical protein